MGNTIAEKILSRVAGCAVHVGDIIYPEPDLITIHDWYFRNAGRALDNLGVSELFAPDKVLVSTDHEPLAVSLDAAVRQREVRQLAKKYGVAHFFDVGRGGHGHIFPMEQGLVRPGMFVLAYDTHVTNYGAVGALGVALVTEISEVLACGSAWIRVPETVRVLLNGTLSKGVTIRDVAQTILLECDPDVIDYSVVEYQGPGLRQLGFGGRMTLCNTPCELGAKSSIVQPDSWTEEWLEARGIDYDEMVVSDSDANYVRSYEFDVGDIVPKVSIPPAPECVVDVTEAKGVRIDHAFVGSCANGSLEDLEAAAEVLKGRKVSSGVRLIVTPGTQEIQRLAAESGCLATLAEAGAILSPPGCGPCASGRIGGLAPGEVSINTGTRNDPGRLGSPQASIYLASPVTVAASAIAGEIVDPREVMR